jgi:two-component system chemotaxis sensor kinase CheA
MLGEMLSDFVDEASQLLDRLNANMLALDEHVRSGTSEADLDLLNDMFRSAHSIKGLSAMLGLADVNQLTHKIENVLDATRKRELPAGRESVDLLFQGIDRLAGMIDALKVGGGEPVDCAEVLDGIQRLLRAANCDRAASSQADAEKALKDLTAEAAETSAALAATAVPAPAPRGQAEPVASRRTELIAQFAAIEDERELSDKYLAIFIDEAVISLDELAEMLLTTEQHSSRDGVQKLLITAHRLKGSAACVGLNRPAKLAHLMEDVLQKLFDGSAALVAEQADALLQCVDGLRKYVDGLKVGGPDSSTFAELAAELLNSCSAPVDAAGSAAPERIVAPAERPAPADQGGGADEHAWRGDLARHLSGDVRGVVGRVHFAPGLPLVSLKAQLVCEKLLQAGELVFCNPAQSVLDQLDTLETLSFALVNDVGCDTSPASLQIAGVARVDWETIEPVVPNSSPSAGSPSETVLSRAIARDATAPIATDATAAKPAAAGSAPVRPGAAVDSEPAKAPETTAKPAETLRVDIERLDQLMSLAGELVINKSRFARISEGLRHLNVGRQAKTAFTAALDGLKGLAEIGDTVEPTSLEAIRSHARRLTGNLEALRGTIDQLVAARTDIVDLGEAVHQLARVADGIQKSVMNTRMVPIGPLFTRFRRVVRDITRLNGKDIRLEINGENTELDKRMIDELGDPLIHMVRNSADHGIESPETREQAGKPRHGTVTLDAFHRGNNIVIQVRDDGKGLDQGRIKAKAIERGLISAADAEHLSSAQTFALIWEPGFSTAEKVTEISGRGMGMDIVKSKIEALNGTVELDSVAGQGTVITIKLPLTLAILPSLLARIGGVVYALPIEAINEIVSVAPESLTTVHGKLTAQVRQRVVSVVSIDDVFGRHGRRIESNVSRGEPLTLVVIGFEGREIGLVVDHLIGEEDIVIKSMSENYRNVEGLSGACVLGDGRVSLIVDVAAVIQLAAKNVVAAVAR